MDRGAWQVTVYGVKKRVGHDLATKQQNQQNISIYESLAAYQKLTQHCNSTTFQFKKLSFGKNNSAVRFTGTIFLDSIYMC